MDFGRLFYVNKAVLTPKFRALNAHSQNVVQVKAIYNIHVICAIEECLACIGVAIWRAVVAAALAVVGF